MDLETLLLWMAREGGSNLTVKRNGRGNLVLQLHCYRAEGRKTVKLVQDSMEVSRLIISQSRQPVLTDAVDRMTKRIDELPKERTNADRDEADESSHPEAGPDPDFQVG